MKLETKRLILRDCNLNDWKDIVEGIGDYEVSKWLLKVPYPYKKKDAIDYIKKRMKLMKEKNPTDYNFYIELKSEKKVIGAIGIHKIDYYSGTGSTGSWVNRKYWRQGYMTEAKFAVNNFAFDKLKLRRLNSDVYADNKASNATQLKMGYKIEGHLRKNRRSLASGKIHDENIYGLLKEDWIKVKSKLKNKI